MERGLLGKGSLNNDLLIKRFGPRNFRMRLSREVVWSKDFWGKGSLNLDLLIKRVWTTDHWEEVGGKKEFGATTFWVRVFEQRFVSSAFEQRIFGVRLLRRRRVEPSI